MNNRNCKHKAESRSRNINIPQQSSDGNRMCCRYQKHFAAEHLHYTCEQNQSRYNGPIHLLLSQILLKKKQEEKCSNDSYLPYLQGFFTVISLYNQLSWTSELLHTILQQNDCSNSSFPVTLWWNHGHSNWNQTESLVFSIMPGLKQIGSQVSWHIIAVKRIVQKNHISRVLSLKYYLCQKKVNLAWASTNRLWQHTEFHPNRYLNLWENGHQSIDFLYNCDLEWRSKSSKLKTKYRV